MSVSSVPSVSSVSLGTTEALIDEVFLFGRVLRDALVSEGDGHIPRALTGVLLVLAARGECRQNELATELCVSQSSLSRQITDLVDVGYVTRHSDPADGRAFRIRVSPEGMAYVKHVRTQRAERMQKLMTGWNETEAAIALESIRHLKETLFDPEHRIVTSSNPIGTHSV
ncbi:MarR family winged helix-turn-helix transcriptional regulator [Rhodococcus jostii]|uniref:DNA-binding transcriptional regulator, MarR family n=1 Tax=Rhodococcus jostii TaxID=132919 RepID=A0A1H5HDM4_RHOJO|nr:MarR family transcriptional regulator [Rhodococcus jostii]SEE26093.1 DNA-binding transcriptional regulator, MarR family [Rhodococcus jostii]